MTVEENLRDVPKHAADFAARTAFTYTVLDHRDEVVGCVYVYPSGGNQARVRFVVRRA